jgi:molybdopterin-guanine dinucleotide biosynthesis protein A
LTDKLALLMWAARADRPELCVTPLIHALAARALDCEVEIHFAGPAVTGVVLAGGLGRRMGGTDKGLQELRGQPMVHWVIERLAPQVDELLINANQNGERYAAFGHRVVPDQIPGFAGPLAGLHAALATATHPLVATAPCDSPFLPADLISRLFSGVDRSRCRSRRGPTFDQAHPVFCLCQRSVLPHLTEFLESGGRKVDRWYST